MLSGPIQLPLFSCCPLPRFRSGLQTVPDQPSDKVLYGMVVNKDHSLHCLRNLSDLRDNDKLCDVTIEAEGRTFTAHRAVLASCSPYFKAMFCCGMEEANKPVVTIRDIPSEAMKIILDYCYTGEAEINEHNVQFLLPAASLLQLEFVRDSCCSFLKNQLCSTNCLGVLSFANTHDCHELKDAAHLYAKHHYLDILESEEFLDQSVEDLVILLQSEELNIQNESQVYESVMRWVKHDITNRKDKLFQLLEHVRLPLIEVEYLVSCVGSEPLIRQNEACRDLIDEAKDYLLLPDYRSKLRGPRTRPRKHIKSSDILFAVGGWCNGDAINMVEKYNIKTNEWKQVASMNKRRCGVGIAVLNNFLFAIGGHDGSSYLNSVERYDPVTDVWSCTVAPTSTCRTSVGVAVLDDKIYAVGGQDGISCLNVVEWYVLVMLKLDHITSFIFCSLHLFSYDPERNRWSQIAPMNTQRLGVAVGVVNGYLYAVGGSNGTCPLNSVER